MPTLKNTTNQPVPIGGGYQIEAGGTRLVQSITDEMQREVDRGRLVVVQGTPTDKTTSVGNPVQEPTLVDPPKQDPPKQDPPANDPPKDLPAKAGTPNAAQNTGDKK